jgi:TolB-like protein/Tfp pilus assembly protein PilF
LKKLFSELKRRAVFKSLLVYLGVCWLVLQIIAVLTPTLNLNPLLGSALFVLLICCLPLVIYFAWYFDISLAGVKRTPDLNEQASAGKTSWHRGHFAGLTLVMLVSVYLGVEYFTAIKQQQLAKQQAVAQARLARTAISTIAVLPFSDNSPAQDQGYLALGLAEEMTSLLGSAGNFKVSASRSSQFLAEQGLTAQQIGQRLQVDTVLSGSVQAIGKRLNVRVTLLNVNSGSTLWSNSYARELTAVSDIEQDIGRSVVNLLQDKYLEAGSFNTLASTRSADAYVMYLKGREQYRKQTTEAMQQARQLFEQAVALDPEYARGYVGLADTLVLLAEGKTELGVISADIAASLARQNIDKALLRQPELAEAYAVEGHIFYIQSDFEQAIIHYDQAIELNPSLAIAYMWKFLALNSLQRFEASLVALQQAQQLDPLFQTNTYNLGRALTRAGRFDEATAIFKQMQLDFPRSPFSHQGLADIYVSKGNLVEVIREMQRAIERSPDNPSLRHKLISALINIELTDVIVQMAKDPEWASTTDFYQETLLIFEEDFAALFARMDFKLAASPDDYWLQFEAGWYQAMFGNKPQALKLLTDNLALIEAEDMFGMPYCSPAIEIAWAERELGNETKAIALLDQCKTLMTEQLQSSIVYSELYYLAARVYAFEGKAAQAIDALATSIEMGWREYWTKYDPLLASLAKEPEFQQLIQFLDQDLARQKAEALKLFNE